MSDSPSDPRNPDLDEEINVGEAHATIEGATAAVLREKQLQNNGMEPVPLWVFLLAGISLLVGGAVLGQGGDLAYGQKSLWASDWEAAPSKGDEAPTQGPVLEFYVKAGEKVYSKCSGCHGADGKGDGANYPPLVNSEWVSGANTDALAMIILNGVQGPIEVAGRTWNGVMPAQAAGLGPKELASLMTYLRSGLNGMEDVVTLEMAQAALDAYDARGEGKPTTQDELKAGHMKLLSGAPLAPDAIVDYETYLPVESGGGEG